MQDEEQCSAFISAEILLALIQTLFGAVQDISDSLTIFSTVEENIRNLPQLLPFHGVSIFPFAGYPEFP